MRATTTTVVDTEQWSTPEATVNGTEDLVDWDAVDWRRNERLVERIRKRIFKAAREGDLSKVRNLQKLMLRSRANTLVSVRQASQRSSGRHTGGVDGETAPTPAARAELVARLQAASPVEPLPVRRVHIPKKNGKTRPLGIPAIVDRAQQHRVKNALEPEWEARLDRRQYGFRPGRGCHDAISVIFTAVAQTSAKRVFILDADLEAAFDRIDHNFLMKALGFFPGREQVRGWLKAGVVDGGRYAPTSEGTPQGGVISPLLLNMALQGLEQELGVRYRSNGEIKAGCPIVVTYADDFVVLCHSEQQAETARAKAEAWLRERGLNLNQEKTAIRHLDDGFDFLSFNIRRYHPKGGGKTKILIKPSREALNRIRRENADLVRGLRGAPPGALIRALNARVRGQAAYFRIGVSKKAFAALDDHMYKILMMWGCGRHADKGRPWVADRYFGQYHPDRRDRWVFGDRDSGAYLHKYAWTPIVRHVLVTGSNSPDDPALTQYWADRRRRRTPPELARSLQAALRGQRGRCPLCGEHLLYGDEPPDTPREWEQWFADLGTRLHYQPPDPSSERTKPRYVHTGCAHHQGAARSAPTAMEEAPSDAA